MKKVLFAGLLILFILGGTGYLSKDEIQSFMFAPRKGSLEQGASTNSINQNLDEGQKPDVSVIAQNLNIPWEIVFLNKQEMLVTQRSGELLKIRLNGESSVVTEIEGVEHVGEGGLLGLALHPDFKNNNYLYLYLTTRTQQGLINRIERYKYSDNALFDKTTILDNILGANYHDGGRIEFGPDGFLYVTTGDAGQAELAQDTTSLNGKILRITDEGKPVSGNPFDNEIYSSGHRNPQGLAWDSQGRLWATEHGPSGLQSGYDEVNLIEEGKNYGWPEIRGSETRQGMQAPVIQSGSKDTWAPGGAAIYKDHIFFAGLRGQALYSARIEGENLISLKANFKNEYGRLRAVVLGPDNYLYVTTSNRDGRGEPVEADDRIIRINPEVLMGNR